MSRLIGAGLGAVVANLIWAAIGGEPHIAIVIVLAIAGALAALALQRYVIIVATAFGGAQTVVVGAAALMGNRMASEVAAKAVYSVYPLNPMPGTVHRCRRGVRPRHRRAGGAAAGDSEGEEVSYQCSVISDQ